MRIKCWAIGVVMGCFWMLMGSAQAQILGAESFVTAPALNDSLARLDSLNRLSRSQGKVKQYPSVLKAQSLWNGEPFGGYDSSFSPWKPVRAYTIDQNLHEPHADLGLNNGPYQSLWFDPLLKAGIQLGLNPYGSLLQGSESFDFYKVSMPFTRFDYSQGDGRFIGLQALHSQNFSPTWNSTLRYNSVLNQDQYPGANQDHLYRNIQWGSHFVSPNGRLTQQSIATWNRGRRNENGGLFNDSSFYWQPDSVDLAFRPFGSYQAWNLQAQSVYRRNNQTVKTRWAFQDTAWAVEHEFENELIRYQYSDGSPDSAFYRASPSQWPDEIRDSSRYLRSVQQLGLRYAHAGWTGRLQLLYERGQWSHNQWQARSVQSLGLKAEFQWKSPIWNHAFSGLMYPGTNSYNSGDYQLLWNSQWNRKSHQFSASLQTQQAHASLFFASFQSQLLREDFNPNRISQNQRIQFSWNWKDRLSWSLQAGKTDAFYAFSQQNLDQGLATVSQARGGYWQTYVQALLPVGGHWQNLIRYRFQRIQANGPELNSQLWPSHWASLSSYLHGTAFQGALAYRMGFDVSSSSTYRAWLYRPDLASFYAGSNSLPLLGNYPVLDVFFSGRIQSVDIALKYEHANEWWYWDALNPRYESTYAYPMLPARFRIAVIWNFFN